MDTNALFGCLADATRRRLLVLLAHRPLCVCHLEAVLALPQPRISRHLAYLRRHRLVTCSRRGAWRVYALARSVSPLVAALLGPLTARADDAPQFRRDRDRFDQLARRVDCACGTPNVPRRRLLRLARPAR